MGLLDAVVGALDQSQAGRAGSGRGDLVSAIVGMLGQSGGLAGLVQQLEQGGLGPIVQSWIGTGQNLPVSAEQLGGALNGDAISGLARQLGLNPQEALGHLSQMLPQVVDHLTPQGQLPQGGGLDDLAGALSSGLGGLLNPR
jgi:uncharacterized protein YidB (DUF937 family)